MDKTSGYRVMAERYRRLAVATNNTAARDHRLAMVKFFERKASRVKATAASGQAIR